MKFINCAEALPGNVKEKYQVSNDAYIRNIYTKGRVEPNYFRSYAGLSEHWALDKFEWLDETPVRSFTIEDMEKAWNDGGNQMSYEWKYGSAKSFPDFMKIQYSIDMP